MKSSRTYYFLYLFLFLVIEITFSKVSFFLLKKTVEPLYKNSYIFSTSDMRYLIENKNPNGLIINVTDGSRGTDYIWGRFSMEISDDYNYELSNKHLMGYSTYFLWKDISFEDINKAFNKMLIVFQNQ